MASFDVFLRDSDDANSQSRGITARVQVGRRLVLDNIGTNGIFSRGPSQVIGESPIYINVDLTLAIAMAIGAMGAAAKRGCAEAANAASSIVRKRLVDLSQRVMTCDPNEAERAISITRQATEADTAAVVTVAEKPLPLNRFSPVFETPKGVSATTRNNRGPDQYAAAFIAAGNDGQDTVFRREGAARRPLNELYGPSVMDFIASELPGQRQAIETILFSELQKSADRIFNENFGYGTLGGADEFLTTIA